MRASVKPGLTPISSPVQSIQIKKIISNLSMYVPQSISFPKDNLQRQQTSATWEIYLATNSNVPMLHYAMPLSIQPDTIHAP